MNGGLFVIQVSTAPKRNSAPTVSIISVLKSHEFRQAYHQALNRANQAPNAQLAAARSIVESYFQLQEITRITRLNPHSIYFLERPIEANGHHKFLVPGTVKREMIPGRLLLLAPKAASIERLVDPREFDRAVSSVQAVRLTLAPERVNGIISFISDAKRFYAACDSACAERAIGTAVDHLNRAASDGLRKITTDAEKGKRSNEIAGTRRTLADLRRKLQSECIALAAVR